ncbi:hypothetical protein ADUPG1_012953, partial [Aduncisulcus paluster]
MSPYGIISPPPTPTPSALSSHKNSTTNRTSFLSTRSRFSSSTPSPFSSNSTTNRTSFLSTRSRFSSSTPSPFSSVSARPGDPPGANIPDLPTSLSSVDPLSTQLPGLPLHLSILTGSSHELLSPIVSHSISSQCCGVRMLLQHSVVKDYICVVLSGSWDSVRTFSPSAPVHAIDKLSSLPTSYIHVQRLFMCQLTDKYIIDNLQDRMHSLPRSQRGLLRKQADRSRSLHKEESISIQVTPMSPTLSPSPPLTTGLIPQDASDPAFMDEIVSALKHENSRPETKAEMAERIRREIREKIRKEEREMGIQQPYSSTHPVSTKVVGNSSPTIPSTSTVPSHSISSKPIHVVPKPIPVVPPTDHHVNNNSPPRRAVIWSQEIPKESPSHKPILSPIRSISPTKQTSPRRSMIPSTLTTSTKHLLSRIEGDPIIARSSIISSHSHHNDNYDNVTDVTDVTDVTLETPGDADSTGDEMMAPVEEEEQDTPPSIHNSSGGVNMSAISPFLEESSS